MNNNRNQNRRRGRGNRQQGGGNQNRIDSRARGNAPQMFDKYKKLAQDAAHNGDRVQAEYYLQFADHYFRVIADNKARMDEQRGGARRDERDFGAEEDGEEEDFDVLRQPQGRYSERTAERQNERPGSDRQNDRPNDRQRQRPRRDDRDRDDDARARDEGDQGYEGEEAMDFAPAENPFVRPSRDRARDNDRPREGGGRRGRGQRGGNRENAEPSPVDDAGEIDAAALPPSFSAGIADTGGEEAAPKRKLPPRRRRAPIDEAGDDGETLKAVG